MDDEFKAHVIAKFPDGSQLQRYFHIQEYWHVWPSRAGIPGEHLSMKHAVDRVIHRGATVVPGAPGASRFYKAVAKHPDASRIADSSETDSGVSPGHHAGN